ncbi:alpha/beta hydrolase [Devosia sp.]|uniref:alpha/beta hydrolase n=1 Tax=Devosia sp. TaxID=1871048 RepID=UPI0025BA2918|nr:alpha/beta hydrolase [Devosia sp.]
MTDLFRTRDHVADFDGYLTRFIERSASSRAALRNKLDVAYGEGPDERLDLFFPEAMRTPAAVHLFVHGGYWRMFSKSDYSYVADTVTQAGAIAAIMDYSLMPAVRMETIVRQVSRAVDWLKTNAATFGGDADRLSVSGHSAGAHLCAMLLSQGSLGPSPRALLLSGVYELGPLRSSFLQPQIGITEDEVERFSPLGLDLAPAETARILVGDKETGPFHMQAQDLAEKLKTSVEVIPGNHMSVVLDLGDSNAPAGKALFEICS